MCAKLCTLNDWCFSFEVQFTSGECSLSKTRIGENIGEVMIDVDADAAHYEWVSYASLTASLD